MSSYATDRVAAEQPGTSVLADPATRLALLEAFAEMVTEAMVTFDSGGAIVTYDRRAERIFGHPEAEVRGRSALMLFPEHLHPSMGVLFEAVAAGELVDDLETEVQRRHGMAIPVSLSLRAVRGPDGTLIGTCMSTRDITEQRLAQATLAEIEDRLRQGEALAHVGGWLWDVVTDTVQWTEEVHRIHGVDPLDFDGTRAAHLGFVHPDDRERVKRSMLESVASCRPFEQEYRVVRPDGAEVTIYARAEPAIGSAGAVVGLRGVTQDISTPRGSQRAHPTD